MTERIICNDNGGELREEVVRCRDCTYFATDEIGEYCTLMDFGDAMGLNDGFCAWGKRVEGQMVKQNKAELTWTELRPCPMCGSTNLKHYTTEGSRSFRRGTVRCESCGCTVRAEGGGHELYGELGLVPNEDGRYETSDYELVRCVSNARALRRSAAKWNGEVSDHD